jgi:1-acyl-sn-glycerol-3-phosphate acyltransferase
MKPSLRLAGWAFEGPVPKERKYVMLALPHTSNWDGALLIALTKSIGMNLSWMIKDDWVRGPMGVVLERLGAVAVNRKGAHNLVDQMIQAFKESDSLILAIPPEGTRKRAERWKSGFYHIARGAGVPVVPGYLDYRRKRAGLGPAIEMTGDVRADMDAIRAFYAEKDPRGRYHENFGPIRLKEEDDEPR